MNTRKLVCLLLTVSLMLAILPTAASAEPLRQTCMTHVVQPGENLFRISLRYNIAIVTLMQANGLTNPNYVYVGQVLCIPTAPVSPAPAPLPAPLPVPPLPRPPATGSHYQVQPGDTLAGIAARFGVTLYALAQANGLINLNYIYVGQWLVIPAGYTPPSPPSPAPARPPKTSSGNWKGEYYTNPHLAGSAALVRYDTSVNFDWGDGSPNAQIPVDNFSARWTRNVYLNAGDYRFTVTADDGVRLWVNDQLLIDEWGNQASATHTADATLGSGYHAIRMEYQELTGVAVAMVGWIKVMDGDGGGAAPGKLQPSGAWLGEYFTNKDLGGSPDFRRLDPAIDFDWGNHSPFSGVDDFFSIRWTRNVYFEAGTHRFYAWVDDGARIYVDGVLVVSEWRDANGVVFFDDVTLKAGVHEVKVEYYEHGHDAMISVWWETL